LLNYFENPVEALDIVFLKGYQWPFDVRKAEGSSRIDLIVAQENAKGRTVYMDFRHNPSNLDFDKLSEETYTYLERSGALFGSPIERLAKMNPKAIDLYKNNGIDLYNDPLKVAVCAQHCNGGIAVDANWESSIQGLYVVGEAAGTFGVYRPGGSALNDTQVGAMRAAEHISKKKDSDKIVVTFEAPNINYKSQSNLLKTQQAIQERMSRYAAFSRDPEEMNKLYDELCQLKNNFFEEVSIASKGELPALHKCYDMLLTQIAALSAMIFSAEHIGSRGSALVKGKTMGADKFDGQVVISDANKSYFENVRPLPACDDWFETVWNEVK